MFNDLIVISLFVLCRSDDPYLLQGFPTETGAQISRNSGPCFSTKSSLPLAGADEVSLNETKCEYSDDDSLLKCKLGVSIDLSSANFEQYSSKTVKVLILFVQEFPMPPIRRRVLDLCFIDLFSSSLEEIAICGYKPPIAKSFNYTYLHIVDVAALAAVAPDIHTLLLSSKGVDWNRKTNFFFVVQV